MIVVVASLFLIQMTREEARAGRRLWRCFVFWLDLWVTLRKASLVSNWDG